MLQSVLFFLQSMCSNRIRKKIQCRNICLTFDRGAVRSITFVANSKAQITFVQQGTKRLKNRACRLCTLGRCSRVATLRRRGRRRDHGAGRGVATFAVALAACLRAPKRRAYSAVSIYRARYSVRSCRRSLCSSSTSSYEREERPPAS